MFGRTERKHPLEKAQSDQLENLRDDCIALFINSGLRQKDIHERGGPTPTTISKWLYKETFFPRYDSIERFLLALGYGLTPLPIDIITSLRNKPLSTRLDLDTLFVATPQMPPKKVRK